MSDNDRSDKKRAAMAELHPFLQKELQQLPSCCGIPSWIRESTQIPAFIISIPPFFQSAGLKEYRVHYFPGQLHTYPGEGMILDFPLELSSKSGQTRTISLLLNISDEKQQPFFYSLTRTTRIELLAYQCNTFQFCGFIRASWPEMNRQQLQKCLGLPRAHTHWQQVITRWTHEVYEASRKPPTFGIYTSKGKQPGSVGSHTSSPEEAPPRLSATSASDSAQQSTQARSHTLPLSLQAKMALQSLSPLSEILWYGDQGGKLCCLIKVSQGVNFSHFSCVFAKPRLSDSSPSVDQWKEGITFLYNTQNAPGQPCINQICTVQLSKPLTQKLLTQLSQVSHIHLLGYSDDPTPQYLGKKTIHWTKSNRKAIRQFLAKGTASSTQIVQAENKTHQHSPPQDGHVPLTIPVEVKQDLAYALLRGIITGSPGKQAIPRIYLKVPQGTHFDEVAVAFGPLNLTSYPTGWILSLTFLLQDAAKRVMSVDCLLNPIGERSILDSLTTTQKVEIVALADTPTLPVLGVKLLTWPTEKRNRAKDFFEYTRGVLARGLWTHARTTYLQEHPPGYVFHMPHPETQEQTSPENRQLSSERSQFLRGEKKMLPGNLPQKALLANHSQSTPSPTIQPMSTEHILPLIERCIRLHRAGVHQEYARTHTLSRRLFWRMLLALALEKTMRKFIWTPEAVHVTEGHRRQLVPSITLPWLSSHEHLWIEFKEPIATPICSDTAALLIFSAADPSLFREFAQQVRMSSRALKLLERSHYLPERQRVTLNVVNSTGEIVWAISLNRERQDQEQKDQNLWSAPVWYTCPRQQCHLHNKETLSLCETCTDTRTFIWTWLLAAWQSLLGLYRTKPGADPLFENFGEEHIERITRALSEQLESEAVHNVDLEYRYRVVRSIDIAAVPERVPTERVGQRGSWVEALASIDPALVFYDEREIPLSTRTLKHPRYARYIEQHGTNQVEVRPHTKHIPMRADPRAMTKVTAKMRQGKNKNHENL